MPPLHRATRATTTSAVPVLALTGATSYWASVVANPPRHISAAGARGNGAWLVALGDWPARI